jgi:hypothetical protein
MLAGDGVALGETQIWVSRIRRWRRTVPFFPYGVSFLEQSLARCGSEVERCVPSRIDGVGSWRRGAVYARRTVYIVLLAQGGGTV